MNDISLSFNPQLHPRSEALFAEAQKVFPGGVNSPVRAFLGVEGKPAFIRRAKGPYLWDEDGNQYVDYVGSWGPAILGHAHDAVLEAVRTRLTDGLSFGAPTALETILAHKIQAHMPSLEKVRFVSSGTEACMAALRLARAFTKRAKVVKFTGCYHGHCDSLLIKAGSGAATLGIPDSPGVTTAAAQDTFSVPFNDLEALKKVFHAHGKDIACAIVEPIIGNSGFIRPRTDYLKILQELCHHAGSLLIFDEVMTGFRCALGGVQGLTGIRPDLTTLGKVVGGGMPLAAYGGRKDVMSLVAPEGPMYQAGTLSGNPIAVAAGIATLSLIEEPGFYKKLENKSKTLIDGLKLLAQDFHLPFRGDYEGGMFGFFFKDDAVYSYEEAKTSDRSLFQKFFWGMFYSGFYFAPSPFEAAFMSQAHQEKDIQATLEAAQRVFQKMSLSKGPQ